MNHPHPPIPAELVQMEDLPFDFEKRGRVSIPRYHVVLNANPGKSGIGLDRGYSMKPLVMVDKQAMFAEIAVLSMFTRQGWDGVWSDALHRKYFNRMPNQSKGASLAPYINQTLTRIADTNGHSRSGCWDVILWVDRTLLFVQLKSAAAHEEIKGARIAWLDAALKAGFSPSQFMVVEWDYRKVVVRRKSADSR
jgi:hypothetical protein